MSDQESQPEFPEETAQPQHLRENPVNSGGDTSDLVPPDGHIVLGYD